MKKNKNRFLLGFFFGMLAMAVVVGGVGTGLYFANQNTSGKTISEKTSQKLDYINKLIDAKFLMNLTWKMEFTKDCWKA